MKKNQISAKFNAIITNAISEGFYPCMTELTGSYSDVMGSQIVLAKGNERIVLWMEEHMVDNLNQWCREEYLDKLKVAALWELRDHLESAITDLEKKEQ